MRFVDLDSFDLFEIISKCCYNYDDIDEELEKKVVDAIPVVRCKDCKYRQLTGSRPFMFYSCVHSKGLKDFLSENDYCSYGERKDEYDENYIQEYKN